eukprot:4600268-Pyramimonas_sp.AAC.1
MEPASDAIALLSASILSCWVIGTSGAASSWAVDRFTLSNHPTKSSNSWRRGRAQRKGGGRRWGKR